MSKIGNKPLLIPEGVTISQEGEWANITGKNASSRVKIPRELTLQINENVLVVEKKSPSRHAREMHGTIRRLLENATKGATENFVKRLEMIGLGYRAQTTDTVLTLQVGFTHPVELSIPEGLKISIEKNVISIEGADKHSVGQFAAKIRATRKPEPYKGKGIRYQGEIVKLKEGKAAKGA